MILSLALFSCSFSNLLRYTLGALIFSIYSCLINSFGLHRYLSGKESACQLGDGGLIPGSGNGYLLQILAWRIPPIEQPGRLQSMGVAKSQRGLKD